MLDAANPKRYWVGLEVGGVLGTNDDGATWTPLAEGDIPGFGDAPYYVGLVVCSRDPLARSTTQFDEVSITPM